MLHGDYLRVGLFKNKYDSKQVINTYFGTSINGTYDTSYEYSCDLAKLIIRGNKFDEYREVTYGVHVKPNDIVGIHVDFEEKELSFSINGKNYGKAFDIDNKMEYRIVVCMHHCHGKLQIEQ